MNKKTDSPLHKLRKFLAQDLWHLEPTSLPKARAAGLKLLRICALVVKGFREDKCPLHASALTFSFVMALVPTLVIILSFAKGFGMQSLSKTVLDTLNPPAIEQKIAPSTTTSEPLEMEIISSESAENMLSEPDTEQEGNPVQAYIINAIRQMPDSGKKFVVTVLKTVEQASAGAMGGIGGVLFLYIILKMLSQIEETFNSVWGIKTTRSTMDKIRNYVFIMAVTPVFLILGSTAGPAIMAFAAKLQWALGPFSKTLTWIIPILLMSLGFFVFHIFLPNTKVKPSSAFTGALISSLMVVILQLAMIKIGFGVSKYNKIYGALAAIPIFLFWVQMSWMILLMGAEVAFSVQNAATYAREQLAVNPSTRARLCLAVALMKRITDKFESPEAPFDTLAYGSDNRIPIRLINDVIDTLSKTGLVAESAEHPGGYTLLRDPLHISARDITDAILDDGAAPATLGLANDFPMFGNITDESFQSLEKQLLKNF